MAGAVRVELPIPDHVREAYLEIRQVGSDEVVTVLEILSPTNKRPGEGRRQYEQKRLSVFGTLTNLVEIDLLRAGNRCACGGTATAAITASWSAGCASGPVANSTPSACGNPSPTFHFRCNRIDAEPFVELNRILHDLYDARLPATTYASTTATTRTPPLEKEDDAVGPTLCCARLAGDNDC